MAAEPGSYLRVAGFDELIRVGGPNQWWGGYVYVKNSSNTTSRTGLSVKVASRDQRIQIHQDWIPLLAIGPGATATGEFFLWCTVPGDFMGNVFDVQIKDRPGAVIFNSGFAVPLRSD